MNNFQQIFKLSVSDNEMPMKLSSLLIPTLLFVAVSCSTAKERYDDCVENANSFMREIKREIIAEGSRRKSPNPSRILSIKDTEA